MPRKGRGSKSQVIQTATNQEYGQAGRQAEAQSVVPLPQNVGNVEGRGMQPAAQPLAGTLANPFRPSERPGEPIGTTLPPQVATRTGVAAATDVAYLVYVDKQSVCRSRNEIHCSTYGELYTYTV